MADEFTGIGKVDGDGRESVRVLYYWDLVGGAILDTNGLPVIPTPSSEIPAWLFGEIPASHKTAYDAGTAIWYLSTLIKLAGESDASFVARMKADRLVVMPVVEARLRASFGETGAFDQRRFQVNA